MTPHARGMCAIVLACLWFAASPVLAYQDPAASSPAAQPASVPEVSQAEKARIEKQQKETERAQAEKLERATELLGQKRPDAAIAEALDPLIAELESQYPADGPRVYSARTPGEALLYMLESAADHDSGASQRSAIAVGPNFAYAYYTKAYALIELGKIDQAKQALDKALAMSPSNSQFLSELGHYHQIGKDWDAMLASYLASEEATKIASPDGIRDLEHARALRGQGYALIELNRLDEAKARFKRSLELDSGNATATNELEYIRKLEASAR